MKTVKTILGLLIAGLIWHALSDEVSAQSRSKGTGNPAAASIHSSYQYRQKTLARTNQNWSNYMRGVQQYRSPHGGAPVTLSNQYNHVWGNALGQYRYSNSSSYNPNYRSNQNWYRLQPVR